ncbi:acyl-CoA Delta-9 desaturase-like [Microplitis mediator]|uniref:acyl-CoA Delta-9 desaturase-like n=1 Tax=Microplitis mediator TaxID=375433 RepID=UPI00255510FD|nr:acyl-CoA Delta-9 desaturase-like [Microplitis mediator]
MPPNYMTLHSHPENKKSIEQDETVFVKNEKGVKRKHWYEFETEVVWNNLILITFLHIMTLYYSFTYSYWEHKSLTAWGIVVGTMSGIGVTGGAHRLWTHRAYKAKTPLRIILAVLFYTAGQNSIYAWVRDHRVHHKYTDTLADPHDNNRGFWFSHVGWLMLKKRPEVIQRGKEIDMSDILNDPVVQFFDRNHVTLKVLFTLIIPVFIPVYFFDQSFKWTFITQVFMRYPWSLNITWSVNSFAHMFGYHSYDKNIGPAENILVSYFSGGEGWHNYHHVFPWDYKAAEFKSSLFNITTCWIDMFAKIGWAYDMRSASPEHIQRVVERRGDGTHSVY